MKRVVAVTGATGFIGQSICRQLLANNHSVRVLIRSRHQASLKSLRNTEIIHGELADPDSLQRLVTGADAIVHCAGSVRGATQSQFDRVNVEGTANVLRAITASHGSPRLLFISSLAAREPQLSFYATSKLRAEQLIENAAGDIDWTILRPSAVYGPGDRELLPLFRLMARGMVFTPGLPDARFSMLYVADLSTAVIAWLHSEPLTGGVFAIDDGHANGYNWHDISKIVGELCHRNVRVMRAAPWLLDLVAWINGRVGTYLGTAPMLTPEKLRELRHPDWVCDASAFQRATNWQPQVALAQGLAATPGWPGHRPAGATESR